MNDIIQTILIAIGTVGAVYFGAKQVLQTIFKDKIDNVVAIAELKQRVAVIETKIDDSDSAIAKDIKEIKSLITNLNEKFFNHIENHE